MKTLPKILLLTLLGLATVEGKSSSKSKGSSKSKTSYNSGSKSKSSSKSKSKSKSNKNDKNCKTPSKPKTPVCKPKTPAPNPNPKPPVRPKAPTGTLDVNKTWVRTGSKPQLTWNISFPHSEPEIDITPEDKIIPRKRTMMEVRVVGAGFTSGRTHPDLAVHSRVGSGNSWNRLFQGPDYTVKPSQVLQRQVVEAGTTIDFSARAQSGSSSWYSARNTLTDNPTVIALRDGDKVPDYTPVGSQGTISSFLTQYIDKNNRVTIGPRDVIYLFECYATKPYSGGFDMQDVVLLVSFSDVD